MINVDSSTHPRRRAAASAALFLRAAHISAGHISKGPCRGKRKRRGRGLFIPLFYSGFRLSFRPYGSSQRSLNTANR